MDTANVNDSAPPEYRADLVILLFDSDVPGSEPVFGVIIEVQLHRDPDKLYAWPAYAPALRSRYRCSTCVLVIAPDAGVARWAAEPVHMGFGNTFRAMVFGGRAIPVVNAQRGPEVSAELALLSALAHGNGGQGAEVCQRVLQLLTGLDAAKPVLYYDLLVAALGPAARIAVEKIMAQSAFPYQSDLALRSRALGKAEGAAQGKAESVLEVLLARGIAVSPAERARILGYTELPTLQRWLVAAITAADSAALQ